MPPCLCPICGVEVAAAALECPNCGAALEMEAPSSENFSPLQPPAWPEAGQASISPKPARRHWGPAFSGSRFAQRVSRQHQILQQVQQTQRALLAHNPAWALQTIEKIRLSLAGWQRFGLPALTLDSLQAAAQQLQQTQDALAQESRRPRLNLPVVGILGGILLLCALGLGLGIGLLTGPEQSIQTIVVTSMPFLSPPTATAAATSTLMLTAPPTLTNAPTATALPQMEALNFQNVQVVEPRLQWPAAQQEIRGLAFSPDGSLLASTDAGGTVSVWRVWQTEPLYQLPGQAAAFSADGRWLAVAGLQGLSLYNPQDGALQRDIHLGRGYYSVAFSPDSQRIVAGANDSRFHVFMVNDASELRGGGVFSNPVHTLVFSADGRYLAAASNELTYVWNFQEQKVQRNLQTPKTEQPLYFSATLDPHGDWFATGQHDGNIYIWRISNGERMAALTDNSRFVHGLVFLHSPGQSGAEMLISGDEVNLSFWQMDGYNSALLRSIYVSTPIRSLALSADDQLLVTGGKDGVITLWGAPR